MKIQIRLSFPCESLFVKDMVDDWWLKSRPLFLLSGETGMNWRLYWLNILPCNGPSTASLSVCSEKKVKMKQWVTAEGSSEAPDNLVTFKVLCDIDCKLCVLRRGIRLFPRRRSVGKAEKCAIVKQKKQFFYSHRQTVEKIGWLHCFSGLCETCRWYYGVFRWR